MSRAGSRGSPRTATSTPAPSRKRMNAATSGRTESTAIFEEANALPQNAITSTSDR